MNIKQVNVPIVITVKEPAEITKAAISDLSCKDDRLLFFQFINGMEVMESGNT